MTFVEIQNAVKANGFAESDRASIKTWINFRLGWIWDLDDWTFVQGSAAVTVTTGSQTVSNLPSDFATALGLWNARGCPLEPVPEYRDFASRYLGTSNIGSGVPEAYTVLGSSILVGPTSNETSSGYLLGYEKAPTMLVSDTDVPGIPSQYHLALVHGAKAEGFKLSNVPLADAFDADFQAAITAMRRKYLRSMRGTATQVPAYRPGG